MATRNRWETIYGVGYTTTSISTAANASMAIPLLNQPNFEPGSITINQRKAIGVSYRRGDTGFEYQQGAAIPVTSWEFDVSPKNIGLFLWSLFQTASFQGAGSVYPKYFIPYEEATTEMWLTLVRKLAPAGTSSSHRIVGAVVKSITLSAEEGQNLKATVEFQGYSFESNRNVANDSFTFTQDAPLQWQNATVKLDGTTVNIPGFTMTISNNLVTKFYDNSTAVRHDVNNFTVEGTITVPWAAQTVGGNEQINKFASGECSRLVIYWGAGEIASAVGELSIIAHIRRTNATVQGEDEIVTEIPFECVSEDYSSTVKTSSLSTIAISGSTTVTGSNTTFTNFDAGDLLYPFGCSAAGDKTIRVITAVNSNTSISVFPAFSGTESGKYYKVASTPLTITLGDGQSFSGI